MKDDVLWVEGSLTVEAACVMAMVLLAISVMIHQAGRVHDEAKGAMGIHEAVEKGRHEKTDILEEIESAVLKHMGNPVTFSRYQMNLDHFGSRITGKGKGGRWAHEIEGKRFRPEVFLRKITLIEGLVEEHGD